MKNILLTLLALFFLVACNNTQEPKTENSISENTEAGLDATTGASLQPITTLNLSKEEAQNRVFNFLKESKIFYYATVGDGKPHVRPFGFVMQFEDKIYFGMGDHKASYTESVANPNIEISAVNSNGGWIRVRGKVVFDRRPEVLEQMFVVSPDLRNIYNEETGLKNANFYLENVVAEFETPEGTFERVSY